MNQQKTAIYALFAGFCILALGLGIGRFAYTPVLPLMQQQLGLSDAGGAYLAMSNYLGYLLGILWTLLWRQQQPPLTLSLAMLLGSLFGMSLSEHWIAWLLWRFLAGFAGAWLFMLASTRVLDWLAYLQRQHWAGYLYGGVGAGIMLAGLAVPWLATLGNWQVVWMGLGVLALLLALPSYWLQHRAPAAYHADDAPLSGHQRHLSQGVSQQVFWLLIAYFFEGMAYIISGTFLVAAVARLPEFSGNAAHVWVAVGIAGIPACIVWAGIGKHLGLLFALLLAFALQTFGMALPVWWSDNLGAYLGALFYGATFMGIVSMTMSFGKNLLPHHTQAVLAGLTLAFSVGQVIGPWFVTWVDTLNQALLVGTAFSGIGGLSLLLGVVLQNISSYKKVF